MNDVEPGLVELRMANETNSARTAPEPVRTARTTASVTAVPVGVRPKNDIVPKPETLATTNGSHDSRYMTN